MASSSAIYLDNAATSFPKPDGVCDAMDRYQRQVGAAVGRSAYRSALEVQRTIERGRQLAAELLGAERPERVIFTFNGTDSLNLALHGLLGPGDHVVTSTVEHNSVLRPLRELCDRRGVLVSHVEADGGGRVDPAAVRRAMRPETKLVSLIHASNVTGTIQPIADAGEIARSAGALFLVDVAQSAGHVPIDLRTLPVDLLACPGHKGLLGPLGTGLLYIRTGVEDRLASLRQGGTGSRSEDDSQPETLPDKYESGNHNAPGLVGLAAALEWLKAYGVDTVRRHELALTQRLLDGLRGIGDPVRIYGPECLDEHVGVVSISVDGMDPQDLAAILDESFGIQVRAGLHCAPGAHKAIGTFEQGGTVRFSVGPFSTEEHIDAAVSAVREVTG